VALGPLLLGRLSLKLETPVSFHVHIPSRKTMFSPNHISRKSMKAMQFDWTPHFYLIPRKGGSVLEIYPHFNLLYWV
jgi:hypothetical protein